MDDISLAINIESDLYKVVMDLFVFSGKQKSVMDIKMANEK